MNLTLDVSTDYTIWDNRESVTYRLKTSSGAYQLYDLTDCMAEAPTFKEQAASGGVYTSQDRAWNLPAKIVTAAVMAGQPKPGDQITDENGSTWTVLNVALNTWKTCWRLMCRNLALAYGLRDTITIQRGSVTRDASGSHRVTWHDQYTGVQARVQLVSQRSMDMLGVTGTKGDYLVVIDRDIERTAVDRVVWGTTYLDINELRNPQRIDELPVLDCTKVP